LVKNKETNTNYKIEPFLKKDWLQVQSIYAKHIITGVSSFETKLPKWKGWDSGHLPS